MRQRPTNNVQSVNQKTDEMRQNLVLLFGKDAYMKIYQYASDNYSAAKQPTDEEITKELGTILPPSANPVSAYREMEIIVFRAMLGDGAKREIYGGK